MISLKSRIARKLSPYIGLIILSIVFGYFSTFEFSKFSWAIKRFLIGTSATLFSVPLLFFGYELSKKYAYRKNNDQIYKIVEVNIGHRLRSELKDIYRYTLPLSELNKRVDWIYIDFLLKSEDEISEGLSSKKFLGFEVYKETKFNTDPIIKTLEGPWGSVVDTHLKAIISEMLAPITDIEMILNDDFSFEERDEVIEFSDNLEVQHFGGEAVQNSSLNLKLIRNGRIIDVGEVSLDSLDEPLEDIDVSEFFLKQYNLKDHKVDLLAESIFSLNHKIRLWHDCMKHSFQSLILE